MRTQTIAVYKFNELDEDVQQEVIDNWRNEGDYPFASDNEAVLKAFEQSFPIRVTGWEYGYRNYINYESLVEGDVEELRGIRLMKYILNNYGDVLFKKKYLTHVKGKARYSKIQTDTCCVLTGYCIDDDTLDPLYKFLKSPDNHQSLTDILYDCLQSWVYACNKDYEATQTDEYIIETIEANEYEFYSNGKLI